MMNSKEIQEKLLQLNSIFTPASPITTRDLFFGRIDHLKRIIETIHERGQHAVLYGERGVGKTSLANIINDRLQGIIIAKVTCNRTENFRNIWEKLLKKISFLARSEGVGFTVEEAKKAVQLDFFLPKTENIDSSSILHALEFLTTPVLLIFDEFDSVQDKETRIRFADTIKALSDNAPQVTLLLVGIAGSVNDLISIHPSNERCIRQIKLPRMSPEELGLIVDNGLKKINMTIEPFVRLDINEFSQGFPHYTHLLTKFAAVTALENQSLCIQRHHFDMAIEESVANASESIRESYQKAVITTKKKKHSIFSNVLYACAIAKEDEHGTFRATDLEEPLRKITGQYVKLQSFAYHIGKICQEDRGTILQEVGPRNSRRYRFTNPLLRAFVRIKLYQTGKLKDVASYEPSEN